jgi:hypothetical protein
VRRVGRDDDDLAGVNRPVLVARDKGRFAFQHDEHLGVIVLVERGSAAGRRIDQEKRDAQSSMVVTLELVGGGQLIGLDNVRVRRPLPVARTSISAPRSPSG